MTDQTDRLIEAVAGAFERYSLVDGDDHTDHFRAKWFIIDRDISNDDGELTLPEMSVHSEYRDVADEEELRKRVRGMNARNALSAVRRGDAENGLVTVPEKATAEMLNTYMRRAFVVDANGRVSLRGPLERAEGEQEAYAAMLAAAPPPPGA